MLPKQNTVIIIAGPTAVGKTNLAIQLAQHVNTQIISADSRQCFTEMDIGTAKPTPAQLSTVHHYFINSHSIHQEVNAAAFEQYALQSTDEIFANNPVAIMVGGTGLYIKAFCEGLDEIPAISTTIRADIIKQYEEEGIVFLQNELQQKDPKYWQTAEQQNPQRLMRALEVFYATGNSILFYQNKTSVERPFNIIKIGLDLPREILYQRINLRVDEMIREGLLEEVKSLLPYQNLNALQTVGYKELFDFLNGKTDLPRAIDLIKQNTRHYAKRQMTWFKKDKETTWFAPQNLEAILSFINNRFQLIAHSS
ncbi:MAG: tRNA (adenosine(37)-N6)-dimethylallyltransferase MiaA [Williamsia sp.]|nr:tRNA (adenosine(37)-N6)-dimethylallyltransferase MiaA [Williamsia sp.]